MEQCPLARARVVNAAAVHKPYIKLKAIRTIRLLSRPYSRAWPDVAEVVVGAKILVHLHPRCIAAHVLW